MPMRPRVHNPFSNTVRNHQDQARTRKEHERQLARLNPHQRGYTRQWREVSRGFLAAHPMCTGPDSYCVRAGRHTPSKETDHIVPHRQNLRLFWDPENWQALCRGCHARKTAAEDGGFGRPVVTHVMKALQAAAPHAPEPKPTRAPERKPSRQPEPAPKRAPQPQPMRTPTRGKRAADMTTEEINAQAGPHHHHGVVRSSLMLGQEHQ